MNAQKLVSAILLVLGLSLIIYGINYSNSLSSQLSAFVGEDNNTGMFAMVIGTVLCIIAAFIFLRRRIS